MLMTLMKTIAAHRIAVADLVAGVVIVVGVVVMVVVMIVVMVVATIVATIVRLFLRHPNPAAAAAAGDGPRQCSLERQMH